MIGLLFGGLLLTSAYAGTLFLLHASGGFRWLMVCLAAAGRMALTNYLLQSILASLLFTNYGLAWYGEITALQGVLIVAALYGMQLLLSPIWLRYFECGPFEWLWRAAAYRLRPPFRRSKEEITSH